jgi:hypothetical protein
MRFFPESAGWILHPGARDRHRHTAFDLFAQDRSENIRRRRQRRSAADDGDSSFWSMNLTISP